MINEKWLKISIFIPIWGTAINVLILFVEYAKHRSFRYIEWFGGMALPSLAFVIVALILGFALKYALADLQVSTDIILLISFVIAGIVMNVVFVIYYKKVFAKNSNKTTDESNEND